MADTRGGIIIEAPRPNPTCYACGKEIHLSEDLAREYAKTPGARLRHEQCPADVAAPVALNRYRVTTTFTLVEGDPFGIEPEILTTLMAMSHDTTAESLGVAWDDLCIGIVSKYNQASMHTAIAEAEAAVPPDYALTPEEEAAEQRAAADPADLED